MPVTWGDPSGLIVVNQYVWRFGPPAPGAWPNPPRSSRASIVDHSMGGSSYRWARVFVSTVGPPASKGSRARTRSLTGEHAELIGPGRDRQERGSRSATLY